jgi:hypothetical protein
MTLLLAWRTSDDMGDHWEICQGWIDAVFAEAEDVGPGAVFCFRRLACH